ERHVPVLRAIVFVTQLHLADRRTDAADLQPIVALHLDQLLDLVVLQLHHVFDAVADIDEPQRVIPKPQRCKGNVLLDGKLFIGGFVRKSADQDGRLHEVNSVKEGLGKQNKLGGPATNRWAGNNTNRVLHQRKRQQDYSASG